MHNAKHKDLIITLIKNDLLNNKLITGLYRMGIDASHYYTYLSTTIFELMGFEGEHCSEKLYDLYNMLSQEALDIEIGLGTSQALESLATRIYEELRHVLGMN